MPVHVGGLTLYPGDLLHGDRNGVTTIVAVHDAVDFVATDGEIVLPLRIEAAPILKVGDQVQVRFGLIQGDLMYIITDHEHSFLDVTAYWR